MSWLERSIMARRGVAKGQRTSRHAITEIDAYMLLTQTGKIRLGNMVDPKYTLGASIRKTLLP